jgi:hypothetical protein
MTFKMPNDNKMVDDQGRLLPHWRPAFDVVTRLSGLSKSKLDRVLQIVADDDGFLGASEGGSKGDLLYRGDDGWQNLAVGVEGSAITVADGVPAYKITEPALGRTLLREVDATSATEVILGPLDGEAFSEYEIDIDWVTQSAVAGTLVANIASDGSFGSLSTIYGAANLSSWAGGGTSTAYGTSTNPIGIGNGAANMVSTGKIFVENYDAALGFGSFSHKIFSSYVGSAGGSVANGVFRAPGVIAPYIRISTGAGNWVSGTFRLYGIS